MSGATIGFGIVAHRRLRPVRHAFASPVFFVRVPVGDLGASRRRLLSVDGFNLFSLRRRDFGPRDGGDWAPWIRGVLSRHGLASVADGEVVLQAFPRVLGYAFNPIAFWHCHDREGRLRAVLCEVSSTFGERHDYLVAHPDGRPIGAGDVFVRAKAMHVSPFCRVEGHYRFRFSGGPERPVARIDYHDGEGRLLVTSIRGETRPLTDGALLRAFLRQPLMTLGVMARIHAQALLLWMRRVPWFRKPDTPMKEMPR